MNFNANTAVRQRKLATTSQGLGRKIKRVSDVNAVGPAVPTSQFMPPPFDTTQMQSQFPEPNPMVGMNNGPQQPQHQHQHQQQNPSYSYAQPQPHQMTAPPGQFQSYPGAPVPPNMPQQQNIPNQFGGAIPQQFTMLQQPIVQDMAMQYGQKLADQGKQLMESQFEKWVPVTKLKYYFAVDNQYVVNKLRLLFFPFAHKDWSLKYDQDSPVQPRYDINAPDLYIPTMAYITYVVLAGFLLGMQNRFSPEQLGIQASSALAYSIFELVIYSITLYVANIPTNLKTLDLVAFAGYKFVIMVFCVTMSLCFFRTGYYTALIYCNLALGFFLLRTLKSKVLNDAPQTPAGVGITYDPYGGPQQTHQFDYTVGRKRKLYFLFLIVGMQAFLSFWLSNHLIIIGSNGEGSGSEPVLSPKV